MAHGQNAGRRDREYWKSRLHKYGEIVGKYTKYLTHKKERREGNKIIKEQLNERE